MSNSDLTEKPKKSAGDVAHTIARAGIGSIPIVGAAANELFSALIIPPLEKRRDEWLDSLAIALKKLEGKVENFSLEELAKNEIFITAVMRASRIAVQNHQKEKLDALRNAILNSSLPNSLDDNIQMMFLNIIDDLTPLHLKVLKFLENPLAWEKKYGLCYPEKLSNGLREATELAIPELRDQKFLMGIIEDDLQVRGLNEDGIVGGEMLKTQFNDRFISDFGEQFLKFIEDPLND